MPLKITTLNTNCVVCKYFALPCEMRLFPERFDELRQGFAVDTQTAFVLGHFLGPPLFLASVLLPLFCRRLCTAGSRRLCHHRRTPPARQEQRDAFHQRPRSAQPRQHGRHLLYQPTASAVCDRLSQCVHPYRCNKGSFRRQFTYIHSNLTQQTSCCVLLTDEVLFCTVGNTYVQPPDINCKNSYSLLNIYIVTLH